MPNMVENRYLIGDQLGTGGMGTVYRGWDTRLQRDVAIKRLNMLGRQAEVEQFLKRFEREAIAMAQLQHPNIVRVLDFGRDDDGIFLILEYMGGGSLRERMRAPFEPQAAAAILSPIADALHYVHEQGMIHRDVKPSNILFSARGIPMLTDFGIVKLVEDAPGNTLTSTGMAVGTPTYMAPELIGGEFDYRVDQYALGIIFYEMVTGKPPFKGRTPMEAMVAHKFEPLPDPRGFHPGLSEQTCALLQRVLAKEPDHRFADTSQLALALRNITASSSTPAASPVRTPDETETQDIPTPAKAMPIIPSAPQVNWNAYQAPASEPVMAERGAAVPPAPAPMVMEPAAKAAVPGWVWAVAAAGFFALIALIIGGILVMKNLGVFSKPATEEAQTWQSEDEEEPVEEEPTETPEATEVPEVATEAPMEVEKTAIDASNATLVGLNTVYGMGTNHQAVYSPNNSIIALGNSSGLYFIDSQSGAILNQLPGMDVRLLAFSPDGSLLATLNGDGYLYVWNVVDLYSPYVYSSYQASTDSYPSYYSLAFSPDGTLAAFSTGTHVYVYSISNSNIISDFSLDNNYAYDVQFSPDAYGSTLYVAYYSANTIVAYDVSSNTVVSELSVPYVEDFSISPDGYWLAAYDGSNADVMMFQLSDNTLWTTIEPATWISELAFSADGQFLYGTDGTNQLLCWEIYNDFVQYNRTLDTQSVNTFMLDSNRLYAVWSGYRDWGVIDLTTGYELFDTSSYDSFYTIENNINGSFYKFYMDYLNSTVHVYDVFQNNELFALNTSGVSNYPWPIVVSPDGSLLASSSYSTDHYVLSVWDIYSQQLLYTVNLSGYPDDLRFSSDGQKVVAACGGKVTIYDLYGSEWYSYTASNTISTAKYYADYDMLLLGGFFKPLLIYPGSGVVKELPIDNSQYYVGDIELSADGTRVYMPWGYNLYGYNLANDSLTMEFLNFFPYELGEMAINDSETLLAVGDYKGGIFLIDIQYTSLLNELHRHTSTINYLDFIKNDEVLFSSAYDGQQIVWSLQ